ncbi:RHS repeat-associated protein [Sinobacterium caligoides]|uniref:RHS repeat-associated protein n=1 Tax=Sinobacterium caligoides TaxID=933926 RepID=A0A3N2E0P0_9GAMM|nr:RHS repeat domain-containing protein [Sinobacterium caligoides]ROS05691.1 RHS repeat-associated protein [Sinobacterium caligoides]
MKSRLKTLSALIAVSISYASGSIAQTIQSYQYNAQGQLIEVDGARTDVSDITSYSYDERGHLASMTNALGHTQFFSHDWRGLLERYIDANGVETRMSYDLNGRLTSTTVVAPGGDRSLDAVTSYQYNAEGDIEQVTLPSGERLDYIYDQARRMVGVFNHVGERIDLVLDDAGNLLSRTVVDASGTITAQQQRVYDELSRLITVVGAKGQEQQVRYDLNGNRIESVEALGGTTTNTYDALGRLISSLHPDQGVEQFAYDGDNRLTQVTAANGAITGYHYMDGQLQLISSPDTGDTQYVYDSADNLIEKTDARGVVVQYQYDALNRLLAQSYPENSYADAQFSYDQGSNGIGQLTGFSNGVATSDRQYDYQGRLQTLTETLDNRWHFSTAYHYDLSGNIVSINYPSGRIVYYQYDDVGRVIEISMQASAAAVPQTLVSDIQYQPFGGVASLSFGNGVSQQYVYDLDGQMTAVTTSGDNPLRASEYRYDGNGNISAIIDSLDITPTRYLSYDMMNRLTWDQEDDLSAEQAGEAFSYDQAGNRLTHQQWQKPNQSTLTTLSYSPASNRLLSKGEQAISYDATGNIIGYGADQTFYYNDNNRLVTYAKDGAWLGGYAYNAIGQRVIAYGEVDGVGRQRSLHYTQGGQYLSESRLSLGFDFIDQQTDYIYLGTIPVAQVRRDYNADGATVAESLLYLHTDQLHTPRLATDAEQRVVWRWNSDAFGSTPPQRDPDADGIDTDVHLRFAGQLQTGESPFFYNYYRDYDPSLGRYLQSDPIGLAGGINTYGYVGGNPLGYVDPYGLLRWPGDIYDDAVNDTKRKFPNRNDGHWNGRADAYRHCLASCESTRENGTFVAWLTGDANEKRGDWLRNQNQREKNMDQWNNSCGSAAANDSGSCAGNCMKYLKNDVLDSGNGTGGSFGFGNGYWD